jgi:hypothetical protein
MVKFLNRVIFEVFMLLMFFYTFAIYLLQAQAKNSIRLSNFAVYSAVSCATFDIFRDLDGRYEP